MRQRPAIVVIALACAALLSACGGQSTTAEPSTTAEIPTAFADPDASGEDLANAWLGLLALTGRQAGDAAETTEEVEASKAFVRPYFDQAFTLVRATGQRYTADTYVPLDIDDFEVTDVVVTEPREDIRVVRYVVRQPGATAPELGVVMSSDAAPRITVFRWDEELGHWVLGSHANFNSPIAALCDRSPIPVSGEPPATRPEDIDLGISLIEQWRAITMGESKEKVSHESFQIQLADGQGWPTADGKPIEWTPASSYEVANVGITRNGDLLVASYDAVVSDIVMEGDEYAETSSPRLLTYLLSPEGKWELIALANFTVPQEIPADVDCVSLGS
jgi:hypothetical protein